MRRARAHLFAALAMAAGLALAPAGAALATDPVTLGSTYVYDGSDALSSSEESAAQDRLQTLADDSGVELWVAFVDDFTNPSDSAEWSNGTADLNGLGSDQYLLSIATDARQLYLTPPVSGGLGESDLSAIETAVGDAIGTDDWAAAVDTAADEMEQRTAPNHTVWWVILALVVVAAIVVAALAISRGAKARRARQEQEAATAEQLAELEKHASTLLIEMDDAVRTTEQELGFAEAEFGAESTADYQRSLDGAKAALQQSFALQKEAEGSAPAERGAALQRIVGLLEQADADLDARADDFEKLRGLSQNAPKVLAELTARRAAAEGAPAQIAADIARLRETYASPLLDDVDDNDAQAASRLAFADAELAEAKAHLDAGDSGEAALDLHDAEQALAQAGELASAVTNLEKRFAESEHQAQALIADLESDIARAQGLLSAAAAVQAATESIRLARENLAGSARKPVLMLEALATANRQMDQVVESADRQRRQVDQALAQARTAIESADSFIGTRRGSIGSAARSRLAEARATLDHATAIASTDPATAAREAQQAASLAQQASTQARSDMSSYGSGGGYGGGSGIGGDIVGGIVGGLIGNALSGGSRRGSGWGSSSRGSFGGGFGGSFGGVGRRSGGGGSFGGTGRRSGGGRRF
ncbi:TPM domain-containing protein [Microbacterium indicum]|uniref:TPM domain-containing protein n=1 Tax=Microbacterium indicum TaxID=358100 RepID=UPI000411EE8E|nr:TPM domain-containing protein [Microbacterium indicum]